jgi:hypothetical protein
MIIEYYRKNVYGTTYMFIKDDKIALLIESLTNKKTVSAREMFTMKEAFGIEFREVQPD